MSLLCFKNCRDSAMLLGMPTDQLMKKKVFSEKKPKQPQGKSSKQNSEIEEDQPYLPWDDKQSYKGSDPTKDGEVPKMVTPKEEDVVESSSSSWGRIDSPASLKSRSPTYDSDEFSHVNVYSKKVMGVVEEDQRLPKKKDETDNTADGSISGLFSKFGRSISSLLKRSDSKKVKDPELEQPRTNTTNGYEAGESASETLSVLSEARFWSVPYEERRSGEERYGVHSPTIQQYRGKHALNESNFSSMNSFESSMENRRSSLDGGYASYMGGRQDGIRLRVSPPIEYGSDGVDTPDGMRTNGTGGLDSYGGNMRMIWSPTNGSITEGSLSRHWSMREPRTSPRRRVFSSGDRNERRYASTGNLTDYSLSSADSNMRRSGSFTRYMSPESVKWPNSSSRMDSFTSTPRRSKSYERQVMKTKRDYGRNVSPIRISNSQKQSPSNRMEVGTRNMMRHQSDSTNVTLNLDFDYKAESSRLYVILKSMHGLTPKDRTTAKTNVRVHLIVMPERVQRAYTRRKNEGWTVRFMEKFRFSDINTLNSIAFKVVLNDGSDKERLIGTKAIHMKELILSKGKHSLTIEINQFNFDTQMIGD